MSEDTPEKVEDQPEEPAAKKKTARKRTAKVAEAKVTEAKPEESAPSETSEKASDASEEKSTQEKPPEESLPREMEDGETPTENPSIRRISSKKKARSLDSAEGEESSEQIPTIVEPASADGQGKKRRRRRRKGSGPDGEEGGEEGRNSGRSASRIKLDPEKVEKKAWRIFLSEVSEEGLALVSDQDAKEIGRRSFRLAEIFLEEASKRQ
ncbi:hypothetical protein [Haloferula sp.]|uniref:hypothetical protein n=1 Tax=Haloferula sp. TaxID=2497595 RepID=UPI00329C9677